MNFDMKFWIELATLIATIGIFAGWVKTSLGFLGEKIDKLEKKQDKHNKLIERVGVVEQKAKTTRNRVNEIEKN